MELFMTQSEIDQKIKEVEAIYAQAMAKLNDLQAAHSQILTLAKRRVEDEQINKIRQNLIN